MIRRWMGGLKRIVLNVIIIGTMWKYLGPVWTVLIVVGILIYKNR